MKERKKEQETGILSTLGAETLSPPYISSPSLIYRKTLESFLMRLVIYILVSKHYLPPNSLNITVFVFYVSWSMVNGKERSRPFLFVCLLVLPWKINQSQSIWFCRVSVMSGVWNRPRRSVWISMITGIATAAPIKVLVPLLGYYLILRNSKFFIYFL